MKNKKLLWGLTLAVTASMVATGTCGCKKTIKDVKQIVESVVAEQESAGESDAETGMGEENDNDSKTDSEIGSEETGSEDTAVVDASAETDEGNTEGRKASGLVTSVLKEDGTFTIVYDSENQYDFEYSFDIPWIAEDTEGANAINQEIKDYFGDIIRFMSKHSDGDQITDSEMDLWLGAIKYQAYVNGDVLSIVIESNPFYEDGAMYLVYNYDISQGSVIHNPALLEKANQTQEFFFQGIRKAATLESDRQMAYFYSYSMPMDEGYYEDYVQQEYVSLLKMRYNTISQRNINIDLPMFMDEEGELNAIVNVEVPAGGGSISMVMKPDMTSETAQDKLQISYPSEENESIRAKYDAENQSFVFCIQDTEWSRQIFESSNIQFGKEYQIICSEKKMKDMKFALTGNMIVPYLVALSEDGTLSYMDIEACARGGVFCLAEPLWSCRDIVSLESAPYDGENEEVRGVFLKDSEGNVTALSEILYSAVSLKYDGFSKDIMSLWDGEGYNGKVIHKVDGGGDYESEYYLGFDAQQPNRFMLQEYLPEVELGFIYKGYVTWLGMDENGILLELYIDERDGNGLEEGYRSGIYYFQKHPYWDKENQCEDDGASLIYMGGTDFFDSGKEPVVLSKSCG